MIENLLQNLQTNIDTISSTLDDLEKILVDPTKPFSSMEERMANWIDCHNSPEITCL